MKQKFAASLAIADRIFVVDSHLAMSPEVKSLRSYLGDMKSNIVQVLKHDMHTVGFCYIKSFTLT